MPGGCRVMRWASSIPKLNMSCSTRTETRHAITAYAITKGRFERHDTRHVVNSTWTAMIRYVATATQAITACAITKAGFERHDTRHAVSST